MLKLIVTEEETALPLEQFLAQRIPAAPPAYLRQLIKAGKICSPAGALDKDHRTTSGETIQLPESKRLLELLSNPEKRSDKVDIMYESREIMVLYKPAGLAVHNSKGHEEDNLTDRARRLLKQRGEDFQLAPIQRLDLETSGPVLFGKGRKSCSELGKLFMQGEVTKTYLALIQGKVQGQGKLATEIPAKEKLKAAETSYQALVGNDSATLLEIELHTGRQHQIRRQFADIGHPLFGDRRYRGPCPRELSRLFLHCRRLAFKDPFSGQRIDISCPLPEKLKRFLRQVEIRL